MGILKMEFLDESWTLIGLTLSRYDSLLLLCAVMVILLVVTLRFVPSVTQKPQWIPSN